MQIQSQVESLESQGDCLRITVQTCVLVYVVCKADVCRWMVCIYTQLSERHQETMLNFTLRKWVTTNFLPEHNFILSRCKWHLHFSLESGYGQRYPLRNAYHLL